METGTIIAIVAIILLIPSAVAFYGSVVKNSFKGVKVFFKTPGKINKRIKEAKMAKLVFKRDKAMYRAGVKAEKINKLNEFRGRNVKINVSEFINNSGKVIKLNAKILKINSKKVIKQEKNKDMKQTEKLIK